MKFLFGGFSLFSEANSLLVSWNVIWAHVGRLLPIPSVLFPGNSVGKLLETQLGLFFVHHFRACFRIDPFFSTRWISPWESLGIRLKRGCPIIKNCTFITLNCISHDGSMGQFCLFTFIYLYKSTIHVVEIDQFHGFFWVSPFFSGKSFCWPTIQKGRRKSHFPTTLLTVKNLARISGS